MTQPLDQVPRVIKFRAWIKSSKEMVTEKPSDYILVSNGDGFGVIDNSNDEEWSNGKWLNEIDFELMQFTGLTDKNGKEIYEGDVVYLGGYGAYTVEFPFLQLYESSFENDIGCIYGNIYENPELLESEEL